MRNPSEILPAVIFSSYLSAMRKEKVAFLKHNTLVLQVSGRFTLETAGGRISMGRGEMLLVQKQPVDFFKQQPGRFVMWHIKDMDSKTQDYTELGKGVIDYAKILPDFKMAGLEYYFLEQGGNFRTGDAMDSITESADFFKRKLRKFLRLIKAKILRSAILLNMN